MSLPAVASVAATSEDGRFVLFDADAAEPAPDEAPYDAWLHAVCGCGLGVGWSARGGPGRRRLHTVIGADGSPGLPDAPGMVRAEPGADDAVRGRLELPSGRLCFAGLDEAFAARNAELHPGAFGEILELDPGVYEIQLTPLRWTVEPADRDRLRRSFVRRGDEAIARLVDGGLPLVMVLMIGLGLAAVVAAVSAGVGGAAAGDLTSVLGWTAVVGGLLLAAWIGIVRAGAMPPLRRVLAARRAVAEAYPDAILRLRRVGETQSSPPAESESGSAATVADGAGMVGESEATSPARPPAGASI